MIEQGTPEWHQQRLGKVTASRVADVVARTKSGWGASRANYMAQLIAERLTGRVADSYTNGAMQWGQDKEAEAANAYAFYRNADPVAVGFIDHPVIAMSGASPDRLIDASGLIEIKCPNTATHIETLLGAAIPTKYLLQMQWQMDCTDRAWCDFVSYDPRMPEHMRLHVVRVARDNEQIADLRTMIGEFLAELDAKEAALRERFEGVAAAAE
jgi:putative phage-type endonuclease